MYENASRQDEARRKLGNESHNIMDVFEKFFLLKSIDPKLLVNLSESLVSELVWDVLPQLDLAKVLVNLLHVVDSNLHTVLEFGGKQADELLIVYVNMLARLDKFLSSYTECRGMLCKCEDIFHFVYSDDRLSIFTNIISKQARSSTFLIEAQLFYNYYSCYLRSCHIEFHVFIALLFYSCISIYLSLLFLRISCLKFMYLL